MAHDYKPKILEELETLRKKEVADKQPFKARAYAKVIAELKARDGPVRAWEDVEGMPGIGDKIAQKIREILATGTLAAAAAVRQDRGMAATEELLRVYGIGPAKARDLIANHGVQSLADLRARVAEQPKLLNDKQKIGLRYVDDLSQRIPAAEMREHQAYLRGVLQGFAIDVVGSFRRGAADSGDVDVLLRVPEDEGMAEAAARFHEAVARMEADGYLVEVLAKGDKKCMGIARLGGRGAATATARRVDLLLTPSDQYAYALLYFTGSDRFNVAFRKHALGRGYTLNEHALTPIREGVAAPPAMKDEADIFRFLDLVYVPPPQRVDEKSLRHQ